MPNPFDPMSLDPVGYSQTNDPVTQQQQAIALNQPISGLQLPTLVQEPTLSDKLLNFGLATLNANERGSSVSGAIAAGLKGYNDTLEEYRQKSRQQRADRLAEYDILGRIKERQMTEAAALRKMDAIEALKKKDPALANLFEIDPDSASRLLAERFKPRDRKIVEQGGVQYYADTGEPVLKNVPRPTSPVFQGTGLEAQIQNILLQGDTSSPQYLAAYNLAKQEKMTLGPDGSPVKITPDMSAYRLPAIGGYQPSTVGQFGSTGGVTIGSPELSRVEGFDIAEGARPTDQDAKAIKDISTAHSNITRLLDEREKLLEKDPSPVAGSENAILLEQNTGNLAAEYKTMKSLGTWDAGTEKLVGDIFGDPVNRGIDISNPISSTKAAITKEKGGFKLSKKVLDNARAAIDNDFNNSLSARGYIKKGSTVKDKPVSGSIRSKYKGLE